MDPLTHGLIGAATAQVIAPKKLRWPAAFTGFIAAIVTDFDVLIRDPNNPLLNVELHRQFSHSFIFIPIGGLLAAMLVWFFVRKKLSFQQTYLYAVSGYATHGLADTITSYGTHLLWPFVDERYAWNVISVFDPVFTLGIFIFMVLWVLKGEKKFLGFLFLWMFGYLGSGFVQQQRAASVAEKLAEQRGQTINRKVIKPTLGNQILWSIRYEANGKLFADAVRLPYFRRPKVYEGESIELLNWREKYANFEGTTLFNDIERFSKLSEDYLIKHPTLPGIIGDGRYAMLPTSVEALWGIEVDTLRPDLHVPFDHFRDTSPEVRAQLIQMLRGR